jgi:hypothetical protein
MTIAVNCESSQMTLLPTGGSKAWQCSSIQSQSWRETRGFVAGSPDAD